MRHFQKGEPKHARHHAFHVAAIVGALLIALHTAMSVGAADYAFLVGAGNYEDDKLLDLPGAAAEIIEFSQVLRDSGISEKNIVILHDGPGEAIKPTKNNVLNQLVTLMNRRLGRGDGLILALNGHGIQTPGQALRFCPSDARRDDPDTQLTMWEITRHLGTEIKKPRDDGKTVTELVMTPGRLILIANVCRGRTTYSDSDVQTFSYKGNPFGPGRSLPGNSAFIFACRPGQLSYVNPKNGRSYFFSALIDGWRGEADALKDEISRGYRGNQDYMLDLDELRAYLTTRLGVEIPLQEPEISDTSLKSELRRLYRCRRYVTNWPEDMYLNDDRVVWENFTFDNIVFRGTLRRHVFLNCTFVNCKFAGTKFERGTSFSAVQFKDCNLDKADFSQARGTRDLLFPGLTKDQMQRAIENASWPDQQEPQFLE